MVSNSAGHKIRRRPCGELQGLRRPASSIKCKDGKINHEERSRSVLLDYWILVENTWMPRPAAKKLRDQVRFTSKILKHFDSWSTSTASFTSLLFFFFSYSFSFIFFSTRIFCEKNSLERN